MKTAFTALTLVLIAAVATPALAQVSSSTSANVRNNVSVGGAVERGVPAIDQKVAPITDPVLDSKSYGAIEIDNQTQHPQPKTKVKAENKDKSAPVESEKKRNRK